MQAQFIGTLLLALVAPLSLFAAETKVGVAPPINTNVQLVGSQARLAYVGRYQSFNPKSASDYDADVDSPKSVNFSPDGKYVVVNSLEGMRTVFYDAHTQKKVKTIRHHFTAADAALFGDEDTVFNYEYLGDLAELKNKNIFDGKPVEAAFSHGGRYLWVPYYRRSYDHNAISPSAVAIIEMKAMESGGPTIVRIMPTGPIPKYVAISPDSSRAAIVHWGDNSVGVMDISSQNAAGFKYLRHMTIEGGRVNLKNFIGVDRDQQCGACLRGTIFSADGRTLIVARMGTLGRGSGALAGFDMESGSYLGSVEGLPLNPRHIVRTADSSTIYVSTNKSGDIAKAPLADVLAILRAAGGKFQQYSSWKTQDVGRGPRTIELDPKERLLFVAVNDVADLVVLDADTLAELARLDTDPFAVGLGTAPQYRTVSNADGSVSRGLDVWTTSQGKANRGGGDAVNRYWLQLE